MSEIDSKVIVITGCSSGIGLETAVACAKAGHRVFATMRNLNKKEKLEKRIELEKIETIEIMKLDVSNADEIELFIAGIIKKVKRIDVLFNNAGYMIMGSLEDSTINEIRSQINTDLMGPIHLTKQALPHMKHGENPGLVINMSSVAGRIGFGFTTSYCTSKFGIEGFSESLRREMNTEKTGGGDRNVRVALIEAGIVHTKFFENMTRTQQSFHSDYTKDTQGMENLINVIKTQDVWAHPEDVAKKIVEEIIPNYGKEFRYVIGTDAKNLINAIYKNKDDINGMDKKIIDIMSRYFTQ
jgi:NADP-dependent 3-hydroxy acid dehydrogenase YdfG